MSGFHGLFTPGPTNMPFPVRQAMDVPMEDIRAPDFPNFTLPLFQDLKKAFKTEKGQVFIFPSSGTGGWEAAITNTLSPGDKVLIAVFGQFSHLWADLCRRKGLNVDAMECEWGEGFPVELAAEKLAADKSHEIKAVLVCHNETTTGVTSDLAGVRKALDAAKHPALLMADGISSIASIDFRMDEWGVDCAVAGSQKGFMLPTGLAIVAVSQKALEAHKSAKLTRCFFDFADMMRTNKDGFFPYTPATTLMRGLRASLDMLFAEGLDNVFARHHRRPLAGMGSRRGLPPQREQRSGPHSPGRPRHDLRHALHLPDIPANLGLHDRRHLRVVGAVREIHPSAAQGFPRRCRHRQPLGQAIPHAALDLSGGGDQLQIRRLLYRSILGRWTCNPSRNLVQPACK